MGMSWTEYRGRIFGHKDKWGWGALLMFARHSDGNPLITGKIRDALINAHWGEIPFDELVEEFIKQGVSIKEFIQTCRSEIDDVNPQSFIGGWKSSLPNDSDWWDYKIHAGGLREFLECLVVLVDDNASWPESGRQWFNGGIGLQDIEQTNPSSPREARAEPTDAISPPNSDDA